MISSPLISVVIPSYNHAVYVRAAVTSVLEQDYPEVEIVVIDDGSTDGTPEIAEEVLRGSGRPYRLVRQENAGAHAALNRGIEMAQGEIIAILNSDDYYLPRRLSTMVSAMQDTGRRFAFSKVQHIDAIGFPHPFQAKYLRLIDEAKRFPTPAFQLLRYNLAATTGNFVFLRSLYEEVGGFSSYVTAHDWDYLLRVLLIEDPLFVDKTLLAYRIHSQGTLQAYLGEVDEEVEQIMLNYLTSAAGAKNPNAPGPRWSAFWNRFCDKSLERIRANPRVSAQLKTMRVDAVGEVDETSFISLPDGNATKANAFDHYVDLDLTQITLQNPPVPEDKKSQPRLLLILPWLVMGGAERFTLNLMDQLKQRGWQISIACTAPSNNPWKEAFARRTGDIILLPEAVPIRDYPRYLRFFIELRGFDAVLVQGSNEGYRLLPALRALFPNLPILDYLHFVTPDWMDGGFPRLSCLYGDAIDRTITSCEQVKRWMIAEGSEENRLRVCPIGVDAALWRPVPSARKRVRQALEIGLEEVVLVYAARFEAQKQPLVFVETLRLLHEQGLAFHALAAGDGSLRQEMENKITAAGLNDKVTMLGAVNSEDMPALLAAGDIFFLPSQNEGISAAVYEAMSTGLSVVGADVGGQAELVTPDCGILIASKPEAELPEAYACALRTLIEDASLRTRMGVASRERILRGFTLEHMGEQMEKLLVETVRLKAEGRLAPAPLTTEQRLVRETQHVVEYLQARQEWRNINERHADLMQQHADLSQKYFELLQPKPPSHWFYLWIRQLVLPAYDAYQRGKFRQVLLIPQKWLKRTLIKK